jgi:hypothetical protein
MLTTDGDICVFQARTEHVSRYDTLNVVVTLPLNGRVAKSLRVAGMPDVPPNLQDAAMHCMVIAVGSKQLIIETHPRDTNMVVQANVFTRCAHVPEGVRKSFVYGDKLWIDVGELFTHVAKLNFAPHEIRAVLNGPQTHVPQASQ